MSNQAPVAHVIHPLLADRWSPRSFLPEALEAGVLDCLIEAARWAPSCFNEQPWRLAAGERGTLEFDRILGTLVEGNAVWARDASVLIVFFAAERFSRNDKPNRWAQHDTGAAAMSVALQASALGLASHQMGGFDAAAVTDAFGVGEGHTAMCVMAIGRQGPAQRLPEPLRSRESSPRQRRTDITVAVGRASDPASDYEPVLAFWFGPLDADGCATDAARKRWFGADEAFDREVEDRFGDWVRDAAAGRLDAWCQSARGCLAFVILLDQFTRNIHRGKSAMYDADPLALAAALRGIDAGLADSLGPEERTFFYMPLMHSERLEIQERCVRLFEVFEATASEVSKPQITMKLDYARKHRDIIAQWGRFPHRNVRLGRDSTPEELAFLEQPGSGF